MNLCSEGKEQYVYISTEDAVREYFKKMVGCTVTGEGRWVTDDECVMKLEFEVRFQVNEDRNSLIVKTENSELTIPLTPSPKLPDWVDKELFKEFQPFLDDNKQFQGIYRRKVSSRGVTQ